MDIKSKLNEYGIMKGMDLKIAKSVFDMPINPRVKISFQQYTRCNRISVRDVW